MIRIRNIKVDVKTNNLKEIDDRIMTIDDLLHDIEDNK